MGMEAGGYRLACTSLCGGQKEASAYLLCRTLLSGRQARTRREAGSSATQNCPTKFPGGKKFMYGKLSLPTGSCADPAKSERNPELPLVPRSIHAPLGQACFLQIDAISLPGHLYALRNAHPATDLVACPELAGRGRTAHGDSSAACVVRETRGEGPMNQGQGQGGRSACLDDEGMHGQQQHHHHHHPYHRHQQQWPANGP